MTRSCRRLGGWHRVGLGWLIGALVAVGCGGRGGPGRIQDTDSGSDTEAQSEEDAVDQRTAMAIATAACEEYAAGFCAKEQRCLGSSFASARGSLDACRARHKQGCLLSAAYPDTNLILERVAACGRELSVEGCGESWVYNRESACRTRPGRRADGQRCISSSQCASNYCEVQPGGWCGICGPIKHVGDPCLPEIEEPTGLHCVGGSQTLVVSTERGGACDVNHPCRFGMGCVGGTETAPGRCIPYPSEVGAACDGMKQTAPASCLGEHLYCRNGQCALSPYAAENQPCGVLSTVRVQCVAGTTCVVPPGSDSGRCVRFADDGAPCDAVRGPFCRPLARCVLGTIGSSRGICRLPDGSLCE